jgi:Gas vesicle synthesis protein GvpL/GvpF
VADELGRWAATRAPELLARAEAEAVQVLRDALVAAALPRGTATPTAADAPPPTAKPPEPAGEALWVYCVSRADGASPPAGEGVAGSPVELVEHDGLAAFVSRVPVAEFGEEPLRRNLNELAWLERVARAHEGVLERALAIASIAPLRLCTIYDGPAGVRMMLGAAHARFLSVLDLLDGRQEWGVKLLLDPAQVAAEARRRLPDAEEEEAEVAERGEGAGYMLRRRLERRIADAADALATDVAEEVHANLVGSAVAGVTRPAQNRELSGHEGDMALNAAYLVEAKRVDGLRELFAILEAHHSRVGARIELTGPWPPYNFVPHDGAEALA